jgi:hypothetical protein
MRRLFLLALIAGAVAVVIRALRRDGPGEAGVGGTSVLGAEPVVGGEPVVRAEPVMGADPLVGGEPVAASAGHVSVGPVEKQEAEEPPSGPGETPGTTAPPL